MKKKRLIARIYYFPYRSFLWHVYQLVLLPLVHVIPMYQQYY